MITIQEAEYGRKAALRQLLELYKYDFSAYDPEDVDENGCYGYPYLDLYWTEAGRHPFFIRVEGRLAGFALVRELGANARGQTIYSMAEFFVMRLYRQRGVGQHAAVALFERFRGAWKVGQIEANVPAQLFWRRTIGKYTNENYEEIRESGWDGPIQSFSS
ncbi:GNAT family N-acetyltransferase [Cohnella nanjingensis]|uniref:GNAT family N-acetyltransferase n=1 Tax=Cohnella nanjingensis TaxID=1387779 RepID=A0A7X0RLH1_9BACL|nr:GNAT family N-acetyltransferase [Cohnella nanjingensis]MBB6669546.1 GNAT family N-acetyltransferase [Cohnella nanjingensis]